LINKENFENITSSLQNSNWHLLQSAMQQRVRFDQGSGGSEPAKPGTFLYHISYYASKENLDIKKGEVAGVDKAHAAKSRKAPLTHSDSLDMLWELGFRSPKKEKKVFKGIQPVIDYCIAFESGRDKLPYEIDGMVIKVNDFSLQDKMGMTTHHPLGHRV
jgi:DNA ligase (NAD+)